jgi:hypothetical protein
MGFTRVFKGLRRWYAACIFMLTSGCFFFLPLLEEEPNMPPVIEFSNPEPDGVFLLNSPTGSVAWIAVTDPDPDDTVEYLWTISGLGPQGSAQAFVNKNYQGSSITLAPDSVYEGRTLSCAVYDSIGASARISWTIAIGEGLGG